MALTDYRDGFPFPKGDPLPPQLAQNFVGSCWLNLLVPYDSPLGCPVANDTFEPGCRNNWHRHPGGQILLVTGGRGWYRAEGQPARELRPGDVVEIPVGLKHWHGAASDSWFSHLAVEADAEAGPAEWLEPVSDADYKNLP